MEKNLEISQEFENQEFEKKKKRYFEKKSLQVLSALREHKKIGLWETHPDEKPESWKHVSEHCLVEAARTEIFADQLGLDKTLKKDLMLAATIHDFFKRKEIKEYFRGGEGGFEAFEAAGREEKKIMKEAGISNRVMKIVDSLGYEFWKDYDMDEIKNRDDFSDEEVARMILNYTDAFTRGSDWAKQSENLENDLINEDLNMNLSAGSKINDIDRRFLKAAQNPDYHQFNIDGRKRFGGKTTFELEHQGAHLIEKKLTELIEKRTGQKIDPLDLPEYIDNEIKKRISDS